MELLLATVGGFIVSVIYVGISAANMNLEETKKLQELANHHCNRFNLFIALANFADNNRDNELGRQWDQKATEEHRKITEIADKIKRI